MNIRFVVFAAVCALMVGCGSKPVEEGDERVGATPTLSKYPAALKAGDNEEVKMAEALMDYQEASSFCRRVHNFYERKAKYMEGTKLTVGSVGGLAGALGAMLATAGTGGYWGGIGSAVSSVTSATLGSAEKGPLAPSAYAAHREITARSLADSSSKLSAQKTGSEVFLNAVSLLSSCPAPRTQ